MSHKNINPMSNNTQLPAEVKIEIDNKAGEYADQMHAYVGDDIHVGYIAGATEYANKLHEERQATDEKIDKALHAERNKMQQRFTESETEWANKLHLVEQELLLNKTALELVGEKYVTSRSLLEKVFRRYAEIHEWDMKIHNEIKTFLDGTK